MKTKHTAGPWAVQGEWITRPEKVGESEDDYQSGSYIAHVAGGRDVCDANARLIAASPDLLAACEDLVRCDERRKSTGADAIVCGLTVKYARAAIAKAGG